MILKIFKQYLKTDKNTYRFFVGKKFLPDLVKILSILSQPLDKLFLNKIENRKK